MGEIVEIPKTPRHITINDIRGIISSVRIISGKTLYTVRVSREYVNHVNGITHKNIIIAEDKHIRKVKL